MLRDFTGGIQKVYLKIFQVYFKYFVSAFQLYFKYASDVFNITSLFKVWFYYV